MIRRWKLAAAIVGTLALTGLGVALAVGLSRVPAGTVAATAAFPAPQQIHLEQGITASTVTKQASVVAMEVRSQFERRGELLLPAGSRVSIDGATFHSLSAQLATVDATVRGPRLGRWQLVLIREAGQWLLLGTRKLP
jgi:hypothetical protein